MASEPTGILPEVGVPAFHLFHIVVAASAPSLSHLGFLFGFPVWVSRLGFPFGFPVWVSRLGFPFGFPVRGCSHSILTKPLVEPTQPPTESNPMRFLRYKEDITLKDKERLKELLKVHTHHLMSDETRRELFSNTSRGEKRRNSVPTTVAHLLAPSI